MRDKFAAQSRSYQTSPPFFLHCLAELGQAEPEGRGNLISKVF